MIKIYQTILSSLLFLIVLLLVYIIHVYFFSVNVVFYAAIYDALIATVICGLAINLIQYFSKLGKYEKFLIIVIWFLSGYAFAISLPTVLDRSLSFYILEKLQQRGGGIQAEKISDVFTQEYVKEHRLVDIRLTEQIQSGTIIIDNGCVKLTEKGKKIASISRFIRMNFLAKKRLINGSYTDDLTNPFKDSIPSPDYLCQ